MAQWDWLTKPKKVYQKWFVVRVIAKAALLFLLINLCYLVTNPLEAFSRLTFYNVAFPPRERLPYADNPSATYNLSLQKVEGLFASHELVTEDKADDEFRVIVLGDSGVWGWLLENDETLNACLNRGNYQTADGRRLRVYNLGYPVTSVTKDALLMEEALHYEIDAVVWFVTLQAMYKDEQLRHPILQTNADRARDFVDRYDLALDTTSLPDDPPVWDRTLIGQRRELADLIRHQIYGIAWSVTGVDHMNPRFFRPPPSNLLDGIDIPTRSYITPVLIPNFRPLDGIQIPTGNTSYLSPNYLAWDVLEAGVQMAHDNDANVLIVNEPIFITDGKNRENRYNDLYPVWAYDSYRQQLGERATSQGWDYQDIWNIVPAEKFTDYPLHFTADEVCRIAEMLAPAMLQLAE